MTTSFYAGPTRGYLQVDTWGELIAAVQAGSMGETQWVECKEAVPASASKANLELAKDLASLTVDGGVFVIGVKDKAFTAEDVVGTADDIEALKTRISQIASGPRVQPAMNVVFGDLLPHPDDAGRNVLLVSVPPSPSAPHMVDGQYWGRSAEGKRALNDAEVARLFAERRLAADDFEAKLRAISDEFDPVPAAERNLVHFSVLVRPETPPRHHFIEQIDKREQFVGALIGACQGTSYQPRRYPSFTDLGHRYAHPDGPAWEGTVNPPRNTANPYDVALAEGQYMRLLVGHDGAVRVAAARGSNPLHEGGTQIDFGYIVEVLHQAMALAGFLGRNTMAYPGMWRVGVHVSGMKDHLGYPPSGFRSEKGQPFAVAEYVHTTAASTADLTDNAVPVIDRVLRNLARASGLRGDLSQYMNPETSRLP